MSKIAYYILLVVFLMFVIPIAIVGGVGSGIKVPGIITNIAEIMPDQSTEAKLSGGNGDIKIKVYKTDKKAIEEMYLEEYIRGVVAGEMPASFEIEALKAQAIAARTFAVANMKEFGGSGYTVPSHKGADVCTDVHCQAWISKDERFKNWSQKDAVSYWNKITQAVESTKGMVVTYNKQLAMRLKYHSTSGGKTEDSIDVFGYKEPYLVSVQSPYEEETPSYESKVIFTRSEFIKRMKSLNSTIKINAAKLTSEIKIIERTEGGGVITVKIGDKTFKGTDVRWGLNLKSTNFDVKVDSKYVTFNVKGYGHRVGMSQWGAGEMAKKGSKFDEILKHYYKGTEINQIQSIFKTTTK
jgi:stage II sporulation protein D